MDRDGLFEASKGVSLTLFQAALIRAMGEGDPSVSQTRLKLYSG